MELKQKPVSVFQGDGICISRILAREPSVGESSRIFYRSAEGVPFRWEMQPGTPKNPQEDEVIPPICPSPLMQSSGLPLPNLEIDEPDSKTSMIRRFSKMVKKRINDHILVGRKRETQESSTSNLVADVSTDHSPFCCSPWNSQAILDEGNTRIYYCSQHKNAFAVEEDDLFLSRILSGVSAAEHFSGPLHGENSPAGVPLEWEIHPGTPKAAAEDEPIPPPSPPPAVQNLGGLARPTPAEGKTSALKKALFWIRRYGRKKESNKMQRVISLRYHGEMDEGLNASSLRKSDSVSSVSSISRLWKIRRHYVVVLARRKWNSLTN